MKIMQIAKGFGKATGWKLIFTLLVACGGIVWLGYSVDSHVLHNMLMVSMAIIIGTPAVLFFHYLAGTRPALPYRGVTIHRMYIPGVRDFDGSYGPK